MSTGPTRPNIVDEVPWADDLTDYDRDHLLTYLRLLDAQADGASSSEMARIILGIDPIKERHRAERVVASHLRRALWMADHGYQDLIRQSGQSKD